jgi:hypothetical protein
MVRRRLSMETTKINGTVKKAGTRVTRTEHNLQVEDIFDISFELSADQKKKYENNPTELIKHLLTQEGLAFKDVVIRGPHSTPISHLRTAWFHIVYDAARPGQVCTWHLYSY